MLPFDPKKPLYGLTARFPHAKRRIHLFADGGHIYFRPKNAPDDWVGVLIDEPHLQQHIKQHQHFSHIRKRVSNLMASTQFFRVFWLPDPRQGEKQAWQILWNPELVYVIPIGQAKGFQGAFCWPRKSQNKFNFWKIHTEALQHHFEVEWNDPQSDVRAALPWCDLAPAPIGMERNWRAIKWLRGGRTELETILRAAHICEKSWPEESTLFLNLHFPALKQQVLNRRVFCSHFSWEIDPQNRLTRIATRLCEQNCGVYNLPDGNRSGWHHLWRQGKTPGDLYKQTNIAIIIEPPTHHERMEAALLLRDWLRENAPDLLADWFPKAV